MTGVLRNHPEYLAPTALEHAWKEVAASAGTKLVEIGRSVEGRPLWRLDAGPSDAPSVFLTGLIHGVEMIGGLALLETARRLQGAGTRLVVLPICNPDALFANAARLARGRIAFQRCNAHRVDLNRNFPRVSAHRSWHPMSGSRFRLSPHYVGPHALSEPESEAIAQVASEVQPGLALGFHSFGNLLLHPRGFTREPHPDTARFRALGGAFTGAQERPYKVMSSARLYPVLGDLDDWLDARFGTRAFTVEVGQLDRRLLDPRRLVNPFWWMNPTAVTATVGNAAAGAVALVQAWRAELAWSPRRSYASAGASAIR